MTIPVSNIITRAQNILLDPAPGVFWVTAELIDYLNTGVGSLISLKRDVNLKTTPFTLVINDPHQTLPSDGVQFVEIVRTLTGAINGVIQIDKNHLDHADPSWPVSSAAGIQYYMSDSRNPKQFWVYPTPANTQQVELVYCAVHPAVTSTSDTLTIDEIYELPLTYFVISMAYSKNSKRQDITKAQMYESFFANMINGSAQDQNLFSPRIPPSNQ